ncbi:MAG: YihA family ribosome biogenesis GTP-binding protein [Sphingobacteriales bacterium]|jgi:GTP-binding protein|nr:YihA family ribosome biogenesis GTP-binding protein [Sphingobacteriales bacterium]MBP6664291.1 YihA family ribosome biogenesis GTP-binding protein [Chitinophagales bacterium]
MEVKTANFVGSFTNISQCPPPDRPEYAFIGRSNVGKSSLINMITNHSGLAKVSSTPGKTQSINHFLINQKWFLVDLPGYGYAKSSKTQREKWQQMLRQYLNRRDNLQCVFVLIDSRISPQKSDLEFINWLGEMHISFVLVFTKTDNRKYKPQNIEVFKKALLETWDDVPRIFITSSVKRSGKDDILQFIDETNQIFHVPE